MVLATSNKPWDLDEAMRRRLERRIYVPLPDEVARREMLQIHLKGVPLAPDVDLSELAGRTAGYSGADLQLTCRDASMMPMRRAVEGKTPQEIVDLHAEGKLEDAQELAGHLYQSENNKMSTIDELRGTVSERDARIEALEAEVAELREQLRGGGRAKRPRT